MSGRLVEQRQKSLHGRLSTECAVFELLHRVKREREDLCESVKQQQLNDLCRRREKAAETYSV